MELQQRLEVRGPGGGRARRRPFLPHPRPCALRPWQVTLQELSNLERFVKRNEPIANTGCDFEAMLRHYADRQHGLRAHGGEQRRDAALRRMRVAPRW